MGPLALFYGGQEIIPFLSSDLTTSGSSMKVLNWFPITLSIILQVGIHLYKKIRFRKEIAYEQQLQMAVMSGVRNVFGPLVILLGFLGTMGHFLGPGNRYKTLSHEKWHFFR